MVVLAQRMRNENVVQYDEISGVYWQWDRKEKKEVFTHRMVKVVVGKKPSQCLRCCMRSSYPGVLGVCDALVVDP